MGHNSYIVKYGCQEEGNINEHNAFLYNKQHKTTGNFYKTM